MNPMRILLFLALIVTLLSAQSVSEKYYTKNAKVSFYSDAPLEKIEAHNSSAMAAINTKNGEVFFKVLIKSFRFEKALMQEHFNENYLESDKYPTSTFKGKITNLKKIDFSKKGQYSALVKGKLTLHGVTKEIENQGTIEVNDKGMVILSTFKLKLADYKIKIPGAVTGKIAETVEVKINAPLKALKK